MKTKYGEVNDYRDLFERCDEVEDMGGGYKRYEFRCKLCGDLVEGIVSGSNCEEHIKLHESMSLLKLLVK